MNAFPGQVVELYVATNGKDNWSGRLPEPNAEGTDGPLATIRGAQNRIRALKRTSRSAPIADPASEMNAPVVVWVRGGRYPVSSPLLFTPEDSAPVTYAAYPGETPVVDGAVTISGWRAEKVKGRTMWVKDLPEVAAGKWHFRQLFVNGERRPRPRLPKQGLYRMAEAPGMPLPAGWGQGGWTQFVGATGEVKAFHNLTDVEVVYVHFWIEERSPIAAFDAKQRLVTMARPSCTFLVGSFGTQLADYYLDNVFEALDVPGEWYLDRGAGKLYYLPRPGEDPEKTLVSAPKTVQLLRIIGEPEQGRYVENLRFKGITFQHADWRHPGEDEASSADLFTLPSTKGTNRNGAAAACQAAADVPGVITLRGARQCAIEDCVVRNVGWYGVFIGDGCTGIQLVGNELYDLGAGGVKVNGAVAGEPECCRTRANRISDNEISAAGRVFHSAIGVLIMHSAYNTVAHNHIHDLFYSGVSVGWTWGYAENAAHHNLIEKNHIHHIGQRLLSDMGGVYLLGIQPGTAVRGNLIHHVEKLHYGGWALYTDEGSSHIILENNVCYCTNGEIFHQHYGRENTVRNNILAFGEVCLAIYSRIEPHVGVVFLHNLFLADGVPAYQNDYGPAGRRIFADANLFWDMKRKPPVVNRVKAGADELTLAKWQKLGYDMNSVVASPRFRDPRNFDFELDKDSPALKLGFVPIDLSDIGPRSAGKR